MPEYEGALLNGQALGLRVEEVDDQGGDDDPKAEEQEDAPLKGTEHGQVGLPDHKRERQVDHGHDALPGSACLQRLDLGGVQPGQGPPGPGIG